MIFYYSILFKDFKVLDYHKIFFKSFPEGFYIQRFNSFSLVLKERGDTGLFISLVPKSYVFLFVWLNNLGDFD